MRASKEPKIIAANGKSANGKLSLTSSKLVQDELLFGSPETRSLEASSK